MNLTVSIESAELEFKQILEDFFVSVYDERILFSHGLDHHRRVWRYATELLSIQSDGNAGNHFCNPSKLIIACYLHDIGMSAEQGPNHGKHSRELCREFLKKNNLSEKDYTDVLDTIEYHDRKDYKTGSLHNELLTILSVADDLDAFGFTGIYRYSEIYLARGINPAETGKLVLENAGKRFNNFETIFGSGSSYVQKHKKRFEILTGFFTHYNKQALSYDFLTGRFEGYCGVVQLFKTMANRKMSLKDLFIEAKMYGDDVIIETYFNGLNKELSSDMQDEKK
jgi:HD superfamily phosphodiesterase